MDKDRQAALAKEKQSELVALRGKWFKERTRLYDRETGLPTVAVLVDDLKTSSRSAAASRSSSSARAPRGTSRRSGAGRRTTICCSTSSGGSRPSRPTASCRAARSASRTCARTRSSSSSTPTGAACVDGPTALGPEGGRARPADPRLPRRARGRLGALPLVRRLVAHHEGPQAPRSSGSSTAASRTRATRSRARPCAPRSAAAQLLQDVISRRDIRPVFQPVFDLATGNMIGMEALSRGPRGSEFESGETLFSLADRTELLVAARARLPPARRSRPRPRRTRAGRSSSTCRPPPPRTRSSSGPSSATRCGRSASSPTASSSRSRSARTPSTRASSARSCRSSARRTSASRSTTSARATRTSPRSPTSSPTT